MKFHFARWLGMAGGVLAVAAAGWLLFSTGTRVAPGKSASTEGPFGEMSDFTYTRTTAGQVQWQAKAERGQYFHQGAGAQLDQLDGVLQVEFMDGVLYQNGRAIRVQGRKGRLDIKAQAATLEDDVRGRTSDGLILQTTVLHLDGREKRVYTDRFVRVEGPNFNLEGTGLVLDMEGQTMRLNNLDQSERELLEPPRADRQALLPMKATWWSQEKT